MRYFLLLFFLISANSFSQKEYQFDYLLEYKLTSYQDTIPDRLVYFFTNSKDNSYFAQFEEVDSLQYKVLLMEQDKLKIEVQVKNVDLLNLEILEINCTSGGGWKNRYKFRTKDYKFTSGEDTLIDKSLLKHYKLQYSGWWFKKNTKASGGSLNYIIQDSTDFHLPLLIHPTAYEEYKREKNIPKGIFFERLFYDYNKNIAFKHRLLNYYALNKTIKVSQECLRFKTITILKSVKHYPG